MRIFGTKREKMREDPDDCMMRGLTKCYQGEKKKGWDGRGM
jgi:hypothetical protein